MKAKFITFEGVEGSGKSTQARLLCERLEENSIPAVLLREPGGTAVGEKIRRVLKDYDPLAEISPQAELFLFAASRAELLQSVILPALAEGKIVVCDRFHDSTTAYQAFGRGIDIGIVQQVHKLTLGDTIPDLTFLLDLDVAGGMKRVSLRNEPGRPDDRFEAEKEEFHRRVQSGYLALAGGEPDRFKVIPAEGAIEELADKIWRIAGDANEQ